MKMTMEEVADRVEIMDLLVSYSEAIDHRDWEALDDVFTADAVIDYTEMGGIRGTLPEIKAFLAANMSVEAGKVGFQHMLGLPKIVLDGDRASSRTASINPMVLTTHTYFCGFWYRDELVRTEAGWRIASRYEDHCYKFNRQT